MKISRLFILVFYSTILYGCHTYRTFYKKTYKLSEATQKNTQRINVKNFSEDSILKALPKYSNIHSLDLSNSSITNLDKVFKNIKAPDKLQVLILDNLNLKTVPESISRFSQLKQLSLNYNPDLDVNQVFLMIVKLPVEFLNLQNNHLTELPPSISQLQSLEDLNLSGNRLQEHLSLQPLQKLPHLKSLWLTNNQLHYLPDSLFLLDKLKNLYIEHNLLTEISDRIIQMQKVWVIHAGHNNFLSLPEAFARMPRLLLLHINNCKISKIPNIYKTKKSNVMGMILDNNSLSEANKIKWKKELRHYFLLSLK